MQYIAIYICVAIIMDVAIISYNYRAQSCGMIFCIEPSPPPTHTTVSFLITHLHFSRRIMMIDVIILHACTRGKVFGSVIVIIVIIVSTEMARSRDIGILASDQCCQDVINGKKAMSLCF